MLSEPGFTRGQGPLLYTMIDNFLEKFKFFSWLHLHIDGEIFSATPIWRLRLTGGSTAGTN